MDGIPMVFKQAQLVTEWHPIKCKHLDKHLFVLILISFLDKRLFVFIGISFLDERLFVLIGISFFIKRLFVRIGIPFIDKCLLEYHFLINVYWNTIS
jgi:hypothetical protein